jgi:hypothetical protein
LENLALKNKEIEIARMNMNAYSARQTLQKKNLVDEDIYLKNYNQTNMRNESHNQNKQFTKHKLQEIAVREFNKNAISSKYRKADNSEPKDKDGNVNESRNFQGHSQKDLVLDPILEAGEKR